MSQWIAPENQVKSSVNFNSRGEPMADEKVNPDFAKPSSLMEQVLERSNLQRALEQVRQNKGAPGIDGMTVDEMPAYLKENWLNIRAKIVASKYRPQPALRVEIPKPDGKTRPRWGFRLISSTQYCTYRNTQNLN